MTSTELALPHQLDAAKVDLIKRTIAKGASNDELELFIHICNRTQLDPFMKQIYLVPRWDKNAGRNVYQVQASIDAARLTAQRSREYAGQTPIYWCGEDGVWTDVWLKKVHPVAAKVGVYRAGFAEPLWAVANWDTYVQLGKDGKPKDFWARGGPLMLGKCSEMLALRKAFPMELSGVYIAEELDASYDPPRAESKAVKEAETETVTRAAPTRKPRPKPAPKPEAEIIEAEIVEPESEVATAPIPEEAKPKPWWTGLHIRSGEVAEHLGMDANLICDAVVLRVTNGASTSTKDIPDRTMANAAVKELSQLMQGKTYLALHITPDGGEYYTIEEG